MKRALQRQREEARQEAQKLIQALQEEKEFDQEFEHESRESDPEEGKSEKSEKSEKSGKPEEEESEKAAAIREALSGGVVRRAKREGKSLEVKDPITVKPLFEAPAIPSLFEDDSAIPSSVQDNAAEPKDSRSHLLDDLSEAEAGSRGESEADDALLDEPAGENPWLAAARDNVSHGERGTKEKEKEKEEDGVDVQAAVARLEVGKLGKPQR